MTRVHSAARALPMWLHRLHSLLTAPALSPVHGTRRFKFGMPFRESQSTNLCKSTPDRFLRLFSLLTAPASSQLLGTKSSASGTPPQLVNLYGGILTESGQLHSLQTDRHLAYRKPSLQFKLRGHCNIVYSVAFSPDGTRTVSGPDNNTKNEYGMRRRAQCQV